MKRLFLIIIFIFLLAVISFCSEYEHYRFDISIDAVPFTLFTILNISCDIYLNPRMSINNAVLFYHDHAPSLVKATLEITEEMCNTFCMLLAAMTFTHYEEIESNFFTDDYCLLYFLSYLYYFGFYKGLSLGGGIGINLDYESSIDQFYQSMYLTPQIGYKFITDLNISLAIKAQCYFPVLKFQEGVDSTGFFEDFFFFISFYVGYAFQGKYSL